MSTKPPTKRKREVQVVACPTAFPDFTQVGGSTSRRRSGAKRPSPFREAAAKAAPELDVQDTIREVHKFGATGFTGNQQKQHAASEYERITGRQQKRQKIPTKILVGMRKKAIKREERMQAELKESGVVSHHTAGKKKTVKDELKPGEIRGVFGAKKSRKKGDRREMRSNNFGPAPTVGFMKKGMLRVKEPR